MYDDDDLDLNNPLPEKEIRSILDSIRNNTILLADANGDIDFGHPVFNLLTNGFVVLPVTGVTNRLDYWREQVLEDIANFPEYKDPSAMLQSKNAIFVGGGFAALANPASFHCASVRQLRTTLYARLRIELFDLLGYIQPEHARNFEMVIDRLLFRRPEQQATKESWHRDWAPGGPSDMVFGGWINLDPLEHGDQIFSCVPGTHRNAPEPGKKGFAPLTTTEKKGLKGYKVKVPPGHVLIFNEKIIHEVVSRKRKFDTLRLFLGWRFTSDTYSITERFIREDTHSLVPFHQALKEYMIMPLKSGQLPRMWPKLWWVNTPQKFEQLNSVLHEDYIINRTYETGTRKGTTLRIPKVFIPPPSIAGRTWFEPYTEEEIKLYVPHKL